MNRKFTFNAIDIARKTVLGLFVMLLAVAVQAQVIFTETIDINQAGTSNLAIAATSFDNPSLTFTGTADTRTSTSSTGYLGASGGRNVFMTNNGTSSFQIAGINTTNYTNLSLSFGAHKSINASDLTELVLEYSTDGITYSPITIPAQPTGTGTANWRLITLTGLPAAMQNVSNLRLRWTNTGSGAGTPQVRLDDITLQGTFSEGPLPCSVAISNIDIGSCVPSAGETPPTFEYSFDVVYSGQPATGNLIVQDGENFLSIPLSEISSPYAVTGFERPSQGNPFTVTASFGDNSGCLTVEMLTEPDECFFEEGDCQELFISEYVEGTSFNKAVEILNPSNSGVDLSAEGYVLQFYFNGSTSAAFNLPLTGILPAGATLVIIPENANDLDLISRANVIFGNSWFNGNDPVVLRKGGEMGDIIDRVGQIGNADNFAIDVTLRRQFGITKGDPNADDPFTAAAEWNSFPVNDFSGLGEHSGVCLMDDFCPITNVWVYSNVPCDGEGEGDGPPLGGGEGEGNGPLLPFPPGVCFVCNDNGTVSPDDDFFTFDVEVGYDFPPSTGFLILNVGGEQVAMVEASELDPMFGFYVFEGITRPADGSSFIVSATFSDVQGCTVLASDGPGGMITAPEACSQLEDCALPFFSEYLEGTGNNKCLEIYNPSDQMIDLGAEGYRVVMYFNGSINPGLTIPLTGQIGPYDTYVLCNAGTVLAIRNLADQVAGGGWFNGNDPILLVSNQGTLDAIGQIGNAANFAVDVTLRRNANILVGDTNSSDPFDPADEWTSFPVNSADGLRFHRSECAPIVRDFVPVDLVAGPGCGGTFSGTADPFELNIGSNCWGGMIGREASMYVTNHCGDFDISAKVEVDPFGFAGIMARESMSPEARTIYMFVRGNGQISWSIRNNINSQPNLQIRPQQGRQYMRMTRTGNVFRGYLSVNGSAWQLIFQSALSFDSCLYTGFATHSYCNGQNCFVSSSYTDIQENISGGMTLNSTISRSGSPEGETIESAIGEVGIYPNPVHNELNIELPSLAEEGTHVQILDLNGRVIGAQRIDHGDYIRMDLGKYNMAEGMYILNIYHQGEVITKRFVKTSTR